MNPENEVSLDGPKPVLKGFTVALRDREFFHLLNDIFTAMDAVQKGLEPKLPKNGHHFLTQTYGQQTALVWEAIKLQYDSFSTSITNTHRSSSRHGSADDAAAIAALDASDLEALEARFEALFPKAAESKYTEPTKSFLAFFAKASSSYIAQDRQLCLEALQRTCLHLAALKSPAELEMRQKNHKEAHESYMRRQSTIGALFSRASTDIVPAHSASMRSLLMSRRNKSRVQFYDGGRANSIDGELGGFHGSGLTCFIGGTSGFKTGVMTSMIANHVMRYIDELEDEPAEIWCYIGEDGEEAYPRRILVNIINRIAKKDKMVDDLVKSVKRELTIGNFDAFLENQEFVALVDSLLGGPMSGLNFVRAPETPEEMATFSIINVLNVFDAKISNENKKPRFVVIDYLNLLRLPRSFAFNNRAEEISSISHILDEWGNLHKIPVITAAQASADGNVRAREMEFYNQEHIHECRSVQHHARMMISLLTYEDLTTKDANGRPINRMAMLILKNRDGKKLDIFRTGLDFSKNITLVDSERLSEEDWLTHRKALLDAKKALVEGAVGTSGGGYGGRTGGGTTRQTGRPSGHGHGGGTSSPPPKPQPQPQTPQTPVSAGGATPPKPGNQDDSNLIHFDEFTSGE